MRIHYGIAILLLAMACKAGNRTKNEFNSLKRTLLKIESWGYVGYDYDGK